MIPLLGNVVENKNFRPMNQEPKIIQEDCIQGFRSWLTNRCSGSRVGEARGRSGSRSCKFSHEQSLDQSHEQVPRSSPTDKSHEQAPRRRVEGTTPPLVSTHPVAAIQQRSAVQRCTPPRKLEGENPNGFQSRTASKPGSNCGATGFRRGRVAHRPWGQVVLRPHPSPTLYRWPRGPWGAIRGVGSPTWTPH